MKTPWKKTRRHRRKGENAKISREELDKAMKVYFKNGGKIKKLDPQKDQQISLRKDYYDLYQNIYN